jgi:hypothetical protein
LGAAGEAMNAGGEYVAGRREAQAFETTVMMSFLWLAEQLQSETAGLSSVTSVEVWHSGGGCWGVLIECRNGRSVFVGFSDATWGADINAADGDVVVSHQYDALTPSALLDEIRATVLHAVAS